jgi:hypothetical protein
MTGGFCLLAGSSRNLGPPAASSPNRATRPSIASRLVVARWSRGSASPTDVLVPQGATRTVGRSRALITADGAQRRVLRQLRARPPMPMPRQRVAATTIVGTPL